MDSIQFIIKYDEFVKELETYIKPEFQTAIKRLKDTDPHDLVRPETNFHNYGQMKCLLWLEFLKSVSDSKETQ